MKRAMKIILVLAIVAAPIAGVAGANGPEAENGPIPCCPVKDLVELVRQVSSLVGIEGGGGDERLCVYYRTAPDGPKHTTCTALRNLPPIICQLPAVECAS